MIDLWCVCTLTDMTKKELYVDEMPWTNSICWGQRKYQLIWQASLVLKNRCMVAITCSGRRSCMSLALASVQAQSVCRCLIEPLLSCFNLLTLHDPKLRLQSGQTCLQGRCHDNLAVGKSISIDQPLLQFCRVFPCVGLDEETQTFQKASYSSRIFKVSVPTEQQKSWFSQRCLVWFNMTQSDPSLGSGHQSSGTSC